MSTYRLTLTCSAGHDEVIVASWTLEVFDVVDRPPESDLNLTQAEVRNLYPDAPRKTVRWLRGAGIEYLAGDRVVPDSLTGYVELELAEGLRGHVDRPCTVVSCPVNVRGRHDQVAEKIEAFAAFGESEVDLRTLRRSLDPK